jgi:hypothetical protein
MFLSLDYLYVPAPDIDAAVHYYTEQLGGELVWKIHAFDTWVAGVRLSASGCRCAERSQLEGGKRPVRDFQRARDGSEDRVVDPFRFER